jgi:hypothetical protein
VDVDECVSSPCQNGAVSCSHLQDDYFCYCAPGYVGHDCEVDFDECSSSPCSVEGSNDCIDRVSNFDCVCKDGWDGKRCENDRDECESSPCQNGGACTQTPSLCYDLCGERLGSGFAQCASGGCVPVSNASGVWASNLTAHNTYQCNCTNGFLGDNCELDVDECFSSPCSE